jgi:glutaconate CoA-transferase subunit A
MVPSFMVEAFSVVPNGAWPGSCWPLYEIDYPAVEEYMDTKGSLDAHMAKAPELKEPAHA